MIQVYHEDGSITELPDDYDLEQWKIDSLVGLLRPRVDPVLCMSCGTDYRYCACEKPRQNRRAVK